MGKSLLIVLALATAELWAISPAFAQIFGTTSSSPRSIALGRSDIADPRDEWLPNPALPADTSSHIHAVLSPQPLGLSQSLSAGFSGDLPLDPLWLAGASFSRYQWGDGFSWQSFGVQASRIFAVGTTGSGGKDSTTPRHAVAGIRLRYSEETFQGFLPLDDIGVDLGASIELFPKLTLAVAVTHLVSLYNNQGDSLEDRVGWLGLSYHPTDDLTIDAAFESGTNDSAGFHVGAEYAIDPHLFVRAGDDTGNGELSAGIGLAYDNFTADFAAIRHPMLGTSVSFGIGFAL